MSLTTFESNERTSLIQQKNIRLQSKISSQLPKYSVDLVFVQRLWKIVKIISQPTNTKIILFLLLISTFAQVYVVSFTGQVIGGFYQVITSKDINGFYKILGFSILVILGSALFDSTIKFLTEEKLCHHIQKQYFHQRMYYQVQFVDSPPCDNPDQRIAQDVDKFANSFAQICTICLSSPLIIVLYTIFSIQTIAWYAPLVVVVYFLVGFFLNRLVMLPIVNLVYRQEQLEGDFRYVHMRVRENAESIAFYRGDDTEHRRANNKFQMLLNNRMKLIRWFWAVNSTSNVFVYMGSVLNYAVVALPIILRQMENPTNQYIAEASFQLIMLIQGFSTFANLSKSFSELAGFTSRLAHFMEQMNSLQNTTNRHFTGQFVQNEVMNTEEVFRLVNVTCFTPHGRPLIYRTNLLITGPSGCGKSTLLRILSGLWNSFSGTIFHNSATLTVHFLSQKPYLTLGSLKDQILYPLSSTLSDDPHTGDFTEQTQQRNRANEQLTDEKLIELLCRVDLAHLISSPSKLLKSNLNYVSLSNRDEPMDECTPISFLKNNSQNWAEVLSLGEQQRLCIARVLFQKPDVAVLDEATSYLDVASEAKLYDELMKEKITLISVAHRESLMKYHNLLLCVDSGGQWTLQKL